MVQAFGDGKVLTVEDNGIAHDILLNIAAGSMIILKDEWKLKGVNNFKEILHIFWL